MAEKYELKLRRVGWGGAAKLFGILFFITMGIPAVIMILLSILGILFTILSGGDLVVALIAGLISCVIWVLIPFGAAIGGAILGAIYAIFANIGLMVIGGFDFTFERN